MDDIDVDCAGYEDVRLRHPSQTSSRKLGADDQIDSGLGSMSMGYFSAEITPSLDAKEEIAKPCQRIEPPHLTSLESCLSKLNISNISGCSTDRCDSGLDDGKLFESTDSVPRTEKCNWVSPHFSPEQVMDIFRGDEDGDNHLHMSIIHGIPEVALQIIGLALDWDWLNHSNNLQQTPLHIAVITRQLMVVRRLMCAGASVDVRDQMGNTPLHNACRLGYVDVVRTLITPVEYKETLQNKYDIPFQRIPQDLESRNYEGLTCLHLAAIGGHLNVLELLLDSGANVNAAEGKSGRTILHFAVDWGNMSMIKFLLSRQDTDINARTYAGLTPILLAYGRRNGDVVEELFNRGALFESLSLSEDSDEDISDDLMVEDSISNRPLAVTSH